MKSEAGMGGQIRLPALQIIVVASLALGALRPETGGTSGLFTSLSAAESIRMGPVGQQSWPGYLRGSETRDLKVIGSLVYLAVSNAGLMIIDVSNPSSPVLVGQFADRKGAGSIDVANGRAYLTCSSETVIVDVQEPSRPRLLGRCPVSGEGVTVFGTTACICSGGRLKLFDVSNPALPALLATDFDNEISPQCRNCVVVGNMAIVAAANCVWLIDVKPPVRNPNYATLTCAAGGSVYDVAAVGSYAYAAEGKAGLQTIDTSYPPRKLGLCDTPGEAHGVAVAGSFAYVADGVAGLQVIDVSKPATPVIVGTCATDDIAEKVAVLGGKAYVADTRAGLLIIDVADPRTPKRLGYVDLNGIATSVAVKGNRAYVADSWYGLKILDLDGTSGPRLLGRYVLASTALTGSEGQEVEISSSVAYLANGRAGLLAFDVSDPTHPVLLGRYDSYCMGVEIRGGIAFVADFEGGFLALDVSDPRNIVRLGGLSTGSLSFGIQVVGTVAYLVGRPGLQIVDVSRPSQPVRLGSYVTPSDAGAVAIDHFTAYLACGDAGLQIVDVTNPGAPVLISTIKWPSAYADGVTLLDGLAYVADINTGLQIIDVGDRSHPILAGDRSRVSLFPGFTRGWPITMSTSEHVAYFAAGYWGVVVSPSISGIQVSMRVEGGTLAEPFTIETAGSLRQPSTWTPLLTTNPPALPFTFTDTNVRAPSQQQKFYRVRQP